MTNVRVGKTNLALLRGDEDVRQWDDEELERGRRRDKNGAWSGRPPAIVPKVIHDELVRRKLSKGYELLADNIAAAVQVLADVATDETVDPGVRVKAASAILDRAMPRQQNTTHTLREPQPWEHALATSIRSMRAVEEAIDTTARDDPENET